MMRLTLKRTLCTFLTLLVCMILAACAGNGPSTPAPPASPEPTLTGAPDIVSLGYYTGSQDSYNSAIAYAPYLDIVSVDVFGLQMDGTVVGNDPFQITAASELSHLEFYACISNWNSDPAVNDFDPELARAVISTYKDKVIDQLVDLAQTEGYAGINIDFENLAYAEDIEISRADFVIYIRQLAARLHETGRKLIISVPAKTGDDRDNTWSYPFDLAALGRETDYLQMMTYDQHGAWSDPGSISGADWVEECVKYTSSVVEPRKLLMGLPAYGYDWDLTAPVLENGNRPTTSFSWKDAASLLEKPGAEYTWDEPSQSPSVIYTENGSEHAAWFENTESIGAKMRLVPSYNLAGISVWALGMEDLSFWEATTNFSK